MSQRAKTQQNYKNKPANDDKGNHKESATSYTKGRIYSRDEESRTEKDMKKKQNHNRSSSNHSSSSAERKNPKKNNYNNSRDYKTCASNKTNVNYNYEHGNEANNRRVVKGKDKGESYQGRHQNDSYGNSVRSGSYSGRSCSGRSRSYSGRSYSGRSRSYSGRSRSYSGRSRSYSGRRSRSRRSRSRRSSGDSSHTLYEGGGDKMNARRSPANKHTERGHKPSSNDQEDATKMSSDCQYDKGNNSNKNNQKNGVYYHGNDLNSNMYSDYDSNYFENDLNSEYVHFTDKSSKFALSHSEGGELYSHGNNFYGSEKNSYEENRNSDTYKNYNSSDNNFYGNVSTGNYNYMQSYGEQQHITQGGVEYIAHFSNRNQNVKGYSEDTEGSCFYDADIQSLNEEEKNNLEFLLKCCEESKKEGVNYKINEWILKKCNNNNNYSKVISNYFYNKILKCVIFKNKLNLIFAYDELLRNLFWHGKKKEVSEFKKYMNSIIQDGYTCAYYKDKNSINGLLQIVYKWKEVAINNFHETKMLLNIFHYESGGGGPGNNDDGPFNRNTFQHRKYMENKGKSDYYMQNSIQNKYFGNGAFQNKYIPPPPPAAPPGAPPPPPLPFNYGHRYPNSFEKYKKKDDEYKRSYFNNSSTGGSDMHKNPENITVGFLATLLKLISKKGKKLQNPLVPYTPIEVSYTYQTPPSTSTSQKLNEKIEDFYDELEHIVKDQDVESSEASDSNERLNAYENYKKLTGMNKKRKACKEGKNYEEETYAKGSSRNDPLDDEQNEEKNYSSDTNTTFSSVELFDNAMIELLNDSSDQLKKNKKSKNVNFSQIAIENAQNWNEENEHMTSNFEFYAMGGGGGAADSNENDVFENYRRNKAYVYHEAIAQKFYEVKSKEP
ncbi:conserved Plasmodium protein, unknown function [Plasmodium ovale]|nr:conserved Plasmodium protein, unknown function [Plasmodium ovale]